MGDTSCPPFFSPGTPLILLDVSQICMTEVLNCKEIAWIQRLKAFIRIEGQKEFFRIGL